MTNKPVYVDILSVLTAHDLPLRISIHIPLSNVKTCKDHDAPIYSIVPFTRPSKVLKDIEDICRYPVS